ncbi:hypothetical protein J2X43_001792 [Rhizobium sp. BE258]|nr:hypothetical protein [Rhizobium sp. BE258]
MVVGRNGHANGTLDVGSFHAAAFLKFFIEIIERAPRLIGGYHIAGDDNGITAGACIDVKPLFEELQVLIELTKKFAGEPVVLERQDKVIGVARNAWVAR